MKKQYIRQVRKDLHIPRSAKTEVVRDLQEIFASAAEHGESEQQVAERQEGGMKKLVLVAAALFLLSLAACSDSAAPVPSDGDAQTGIVMLDAGVWPENDYTEGLPIPPGRVAWAMLDPGHESCSISLTDLTENDYRSYRKQLEQAGFTVLEETSEEVRGQAYVSIGTLLSGETVSLSMSYIPGSLTLYLRPPV